MAILDELNKAKEDLDKSQRLQDLMKDANKIIKNKKLDQDAKIGKLVELGINENQSREVLKPDYAGRIGFATYQLTNNNASLKRLKSRVAELEKKTAAQLSDEEEKWEFDGGYVENNYDADRIQIFFDDVPDSDLRYKMKRSGWRWSPRYTAWQRKITRNATWAMEQLLKEFDVKKVGSEPKEEPKTITDDPVTEIDEIYYIDFLNKDKRHQPDRKFFETYDQAKKWAISSMDKFDPDMINLAKKSEIDYTLDTPDTEKEDIRVKRLQVQAKDQNLKQLKEQVESGFYKEDTPIIEKVLLDRLKTQEEEEKKAAVKKKIEDKLLEFGKKSNLEKQAKKQAADVGKKHKFSPGQVTDRPGVANSLQIAIGYDNKKSADDDIKENHLWNYTTLYSSGLPSSSYRDLNNYPLAKGFYLLGGDHNKLLTNGMLNRLQAQETESEERPNKAEMVDRVNEFLYNHNDTQNKSTTTDYKDAKLGRTRWGANEVEYKVWLGDVEGFEDMGWTSELNTFTTKTEARKFVELINSIPDIDREETPGKKLPPHLAKLFDEKGNLKPKEVEEEYTITDKTPKGYGPDVTTEDIELEEKADTPDNVQSWENTFFVGDQYWDQRYDDFYTIENIINNPGTTDATIGLRYGKGEYRTELGTGLKYLHDQGQHYKYTPTQKQDYIHSDYQAPPRSTFEKTKELAELINKKLKKQYGDEKWQLHENSNKWVAIEPKGKAKYIKLNSGNSGRLMVDIDSGKIYGIKAYGVINKRRYYGNVDSYLTGQLHLSDENWHYTQVQEQDEKKELKPETQVKEISAETEQEQMFAAANLVAKSSWAGNLPAQRIIKKAIYDKLNEIYPDAPADQIIKDVSRYFVLYAKEKGVLDELERDPAYPDTAQAAPAEQKPDTITAGDKVMFNPENEIGAEIKAEFKKRGYLFFGEMNKLYIEKDIGATRFSIRQSDNEFKVYKGDEYLNVVYFTYNNNDWVEGEIQTIPKLVDRIIEIIDERTKETEKGEDTWAETQIQKQNPDNKFNYMMLSRLKMDADYFLGAGNGSERHLHQGNVRDQISEMRKLWNNLPKDGKPEWLSLQDISDYSTKMKKKLDPEPAESTRTEKKGFELDPSKYKNQYELNKAIESWIDKNLSVGVNWVDNWINIGNKTYSVDERVFLRSYSGYGGLDKYGKTGPGGLFEFYTPTKVIEKMWALAYKFGYNNGSVLESSCGTGEFLQFAKANTRIVGHELNHYSGIIAKILYPTAEIKIQPFERHFIKNRYTIKDETDELEKFDLAIGNPPYGLFDIVKSREMSAYGEKKHTKARNYVEYFLRRSLDLVKPGGLLIMIIGADLVNGGVLFLDSGNSPVKEYLNQHSDFLDAYRLPDSVFERTGVTSDIIILRKK